MRSKYLNAVLRQDVSFFDLQVTSTSEVSFFLKKISTLIASYIVAAVLLWRLFVVAFPFALFLLVPGLILGNKIAVLARMIGIEYRKAAAIAEQATSSIRTIYAFVGEESTISSYSKALQETIKLGMHQGLAKGLLIGSTRAVFFINWAFVCYYGSRLVMYHGIQGGTMFAVGSTVGIGTGTLAALLSDLKSITEACLAADRMKERFYDPLSGQIFLDGVSIDTLQLKWLRLQMGLVSQEPVLFATSVKENILFGKEDATMDEIIEAAKDSGIHNFISQLPKGYETQVGERGIQMSGGQKQRIAIARAIIRAPRILLLDEATSAMDSESERLVQEALDRATVGRTTIAIAHRLSTIRNADVIAVVQNGIVRELGSHDELIENENGIYNSLVKVQRTEKGSNQEALALPEASSIVSTIKANSTQRTSSYNGNSYIDKKAALKDQNLSAPSIKRLLALNGPEWKQAILGCSGGFLHGAIHPVHSLILGSMVSVYFLTDHDELKEKVRIYSLLFTSFAVLILIATACQHYYFAYMGEYLTKRIRERILSKVLTFEISWFDQDGNSSGTICSRLDNDARVVRSLMCDQVSLLVETLVTVGVAAVISLIVSWMLALLMITVQPILITCMYAQRAFLKNMSRKGIRAQEESSKLAAEAVSNFKTVIVFSSQDRVLHMLDKAQEAPKRECPRQALITGLGLSLSQSIKLCIQAFLFWFGGKLIADGHVTAKAFFVTYLILVTTSLVISDAGTMTTDLAKGTHTLGSIFSILDRLTKIDSNDPNGYQPKKISGDIEFYQVDFVYPTRPDVIIFNDFSIKIEAGKSTALVGQSGSGKSTIISLIERFYEPMRGVVKIDDRDSRSYNLKSLRSHIALVSQEPALFADSIRNNITYGLSREVDEAEIIEAAKLAIAHDFISGLTNGYDTWCGDKGTQLSGGQKQRIAIARAILKNPTILLLDEATSALDSESERLVQEALDQIMVGKTSVVVAHRLSTIQNCDQIAVLDKGKVVEKGTHLSLLANGPSGAYYSLVSLQRNSNDETS
ncbi:hypothetical protein ACFE04_009133 [Oxalis oulophora]